MVVSRSVISDPFNSFGYSSDHRGADITILKAVITRQSKQCGFSIYIFDNSKSKSMVKSEKMALSGLVFARKIAG